MLKVYILNLRQYACRAGRIRRPRLAPTGPKSYPEVWTRGARYSFSLSCLFPEVATSPAIRDLTTALISTSTMTGPDTATTKRTKHARHDDNHSMKRENESACEKRTTQHQTSSTRLQQVAKPKSKWPGSEMRMRASNTDKLPQR
jgi:hypothetical protein